MVLIQDRPVNLDVRAHNGNAADFCPQAVHAYPTGPHETATDSLVQC